LLLLAPEQHAEPAALLMTGDAYSAVRRVSAAVEEGTLLD
jgi:hypothetical protein